MADKFKAGQKTTAWWTPASGTMDRDGTVRPAERRQVPVIVVEEESPGFYRCNTNMGISILFKEDDLG